MKPKSGQLRRPTKPKKGTMLYKFGNKSYTPKSWVLWVSQTPFPPKDRDAEGLRTATLVKRVDERPLRYWQQQKNSIEEIRKKHATEATVQ